jgi:O-antigen ligase
MNNGIAAGKNQLGQDCLILGFFFFWHLLQIWQTERSAQRRNELRLIIGSLIGIWWLLSHAHSATSSICLFIAVLMVLFVGMRSINKNFIGTYMLAALVLLVAAELAFGISGLLSEALGRGSDLSGRRELWAQILSFHSNPILGTGFDSFWLGERRQRMADSHWWNPAGAHNGYLETYLNLGLIGLSILIGLIIATFWRIRQGLFRNFEWGRYRLGFFVAVVLQNWTEGAFGAASPVWFVFYLIAMDYPQPEYESVVESGAVSEEDAELAYPPRETIQA